MDLLPTFARLAGAKAPKDRVIDGHDIRQLMVGDVEYNSPYEAFYYYYVGQIQAVRSGRWKLHLPLEAKWRNIRGDTMASEAELYDLKTDVGETKNLAGKHPDIVRRLLATNHHSRGSGIVDELSSSKRLFMASQGFPTKKICAKPLSLNCFALDFSGVQVHNCHLAERMLFWTNTKG